MTAVRATISLVDLLVTNEGSRAILKARNFADLCTDSLWAGNENDTVRRRVSKIRATLLLGA